MRINISIIKVNAQCLSESILQTQQQVNLIVGGGYCKDYQNTLASSKRTLVIFSETYVNCARDNIYLVNDLGSIVFNYCSQLTMGSSIIYGYVEGKSFKIRFNIPFGGQIFTFFNLFYYDLLSTTTAAPVPTTTTLFGTTTASPLISTLFPTLSTAYIGTTTTKAALPQTTTLASTVTFAPGTTITQSPLPSLSMDF